MDSEIEVLSARMDAGFDKMIVKFEVFTKAFYEHQIPCVKRRLK